MTDEEATRLRSAAIHSMALAIELLNALTDQNLPAVRNKAADLRRHVEFLWKEIDKSVP